MYVLDTNIVSEPVRPRPDAGVLRKIGEFAGNLAIPTVVWHELWFGVERLDEGKRRRYLERYLLDVVAPTIELLPYDARAGRWHASERARLACVGLTPPFVDGQIAATAATRDFVLVTGNTNDFQHFERLRLENWFEG